MSTVSFILRQECLTLKFTYSPCSAFEIHTKLDISQTEGCHLAVPRVAVPVVFNHPEETGLLAGVKSDPVQEECTHPDGPLTHIIHHLKQTHAHCSYNSGFLIFTLRLVT